MALTDRMGNPVHLGIRYYPCRDGRDATHSDPSNGNARSHIGAIKHTHVERHSINV